MEWVVAMHTTKCTASAVAAPTTRWRPVGPTAWSDSCCADRTAETSPEVHLWRQLPVVATDVSSDALSKDVSDQVIVAHTREMYAVVCCHCPQSVQPNSDVGRGGTVCHTTGIQHTAVT
jgi:hypothetical protein